MKRQEIEETIKKFGFEGTENYPFRYDEDGILYSFPKESDQSCDVIINGVDLYANEIRFVKFELDNWGMSVRLYHDNQYIGAIVHSFDDIESFELTRTM